MPKFSYYISPHNTPLSPESPDWYEPLPLERPASGQPAENVVSHGQYFSAVRSFIELDDMKIFSGVLARRLQQAIDPTYIQEVRICLEKHGQFYHPARLEADLADHTLCFVINVALTNTGKDHISQEFYNLKRLNEEYSEAFLPQVYTMGEITSGDRKTYAMFLGEWLKDYHEFHISREAADQKCKVCVWDGARGRYYLTNRQTALLYRQAARILTGYYNITTFEHISTWHHAAGDFILKNDDNDFDLKLITVRRYAPLFQRSAGQDSGSENIEQILQALLIFFLKLSLRMRLDRYDGIGGLVWLGPEIVQSTVQGVFEALANKPLDSVLPDAVDTCFRYYLSIYNYKDLLDLSESLLPAFGSAPPEISLVKENLADHIGLLVDSIREI